MKTNCIYQKLNDIDFKTVWLNISCFLLLVSPLFCYAHTSIVFLFLVTIIVMGIIIKKKICFDVRYLLVLGGMFSLKIILLGWDKSLIVNVFLPIAFMLVPQIVLKNENSDNKELLIEKMFKAVVYGCVIELIVGMIGYYEMINRGIIDSNTRAWPSLFYFIELTATQFEMFAIPVIATFTWSIINIKKKLFSAISLCCCSVFSIFFIYGIITQRGIVLIFISIIIVCILFVFIFFFKNKKKKSAVLISSIFVAFIFGCICLYSLDFCNIKETLNSYQWTRGGGILHNVRFEAQKKAISQIFKYPMGGQKMELGKISAVHNFWLDLCYYSGLIPFVFFVIYTIYTVVDLFKLINNSAYSISIRIMLLSEYLAYTLFLSIEAVVNSSIYILSLWLFITSCIRELNRKQKNIESDKLIDVRKTRITMFLSYLVIGLFLLIVFLDGIRERYGSYHIMNDNSLKYNYQIDYLVHEGDDIIVDGWWFKIGESTLPYNSKQRKKSSVVLFEINSENILQENPIVAQKVSDIERKDVNHYFYDGYDYRYSGFKAYFDYNLKENSLYQIGIKYDESCQFTVLCNAYIYNDELLRYNPYEVSFPTCEDEFIEQIMLNGILLYYENEKWIYQVRNRLFIIVSKDSYKEIQNGSGELTWIIYTNQYNRLPNDRIINKWFFDNRSVQFDDVLVDRISEESLYEIAEIEIPKEYSSIYFNLGYIGTENWDWHFVGRPYYYIN